MSQEQLADRLGITRQSVSKWESGAALPELAKLITLSEMFQVSIDYLVKDAEEPKEAEREESRRLEEKVDNIVRYMRGYHYTSKTTIKGVPLVCVRLSRRLGKEGVAKGIIAVGNVAIGVLSFGKEVAIGAAAHGNTVIGESVKGAHCLRWYSGLSAEEARRFILESHPRLWSPLLKFLAAIAGSMGR